MWPEPPDREPVDRAAEAEAGAAAARATVRQPWWKKMRYVIPGVVLFWVIVLLIASAGNEPSSTGERSAAAKATATADAGAKETRTPTPTTAAASKATATPTATARASASSGGDVRVALAINASGEIAPQGNDKKRLRVTILQISDDIHSTNQFSKPAAGKKWWGIEVVVQNVGSEEATSLDWNLRDSKDFEHDLAFLVIDGPGTALDPFYRLTPGGKKQGWVYFEFDADAQPKWVRADPNPFLKNDLYFDAK